MGEPGTVSEVVDRLREIDAALPASDGVGVFNRVYLTVTQLVQQRLGEQTASGGLWSDPQMIADLDVRFALLWLSAYDAAGAGREPPPAWAPLFEGREARCWPIQYALAGMNAHIERDLPVAVVSTCQARGLELESVHQDYEAVNSLLAQVESQVRRSFLTEVGQLADTQLGPVMHLVSAWNIDKARDLAWVTAETLWSLRRVGMLRDRFLDGLDHTVGMASRTLLTPTR